MHCCQLAIADKTLTTRFWTTTCPHCPAVTIATEGPPLRGQPLLTIAEHTVPMTFIHYSVKLVRLLKLPKQISPDDNMFIICKRGHDHIMSALAS